MCSKSCGCFKHGPLSEVGVGEASGSRRFLLSSRELFGRSLNSVLATWRDVSSRHLMQRETSFGLGQTGYQPTAT
jgi:hypothetical protein